MRAACCGRALACIAREGEGSFVNGFTFPRDDAVVYSVWARSQVEGEIRREVRAAGYVI